MVEKVLTETNELVDMNSKVGRLLFWRKSGGSLVFRSQDGLAQT